MLVSKNGRDSNRVSMHHELYYVTFETDFCSYADNYKNYLGKRYALFNPCRQPEAHNVYLQVWQGLNGQLQEHCLVKYQFLTVDCLVKYQIFINYWLVKYHLILYIH